MSPLEPNGAPATQWLRLGNG